MVCGVAHDTNPHHPRHSHEPVALYSIARELATDHDNARYHGCRGLFAVFSIGPVPGFRAIALAILAHPCGNPDLLRRPDPINQNVARAPGLDLTVQYQSRAREHSVAKNKAAPHHTERHFKA